MAQSNSSSSSMDERKSDSNSKGVKRRISPADQSFVLVTDDEVEEKGKIELPLEEDGTLRLSTLSHAFVGAFGLKYRNPDTGAFRGLKVDEQERVHPPPEGWGNTVYIIIFQKAENTKRKMDDGNDTSGVIKQKRMEGKRCSDLVALGIPYKTNEEELREYFEQFGEVVVSQVKRDHKTQKSKGFGFVRFADYESQLRALAAKHTIDGRAVEVKIPNSKGDGGAGPQSKKIFVGRVPESMTADDLRNYFEIKGDVTDVYIPRPFRAFAFVTFLDPEVAQSLCGEDHVINGNSVHVSQAVPKQDGPPSSGGMYGGSGYGDGGGGNKGGRPGRARMSSPTLSPPHKAYNSRYMQSQHEVWAGHVQRPAEHHHMVQTTYASAGPTPSPWSFNPAPPPLRGATGRNTPLGYQTSQPPQAMYEPPPPVVSHIPAQAQVATIPSAAAGPYIPPNAVNAGTNQATVGLSNLNLNSLITPQAIQAALTSALAGLLPGAAGAQPPAPQGQPGAPHTGLDLTALLSSLQTAGGMPQFGGVAVTTSNPMSWPAGAVSSQMAQGHQGQPDMVVTSAGERHAGRSWQEEEVNGTPGWRHDDYSH